MFPSDTACTLTLTVTASSTIGGCTFSSATNILTLTNPFNTGSASAAQTVSFTLSTQGKNPSAAMDTGSFQVVTRATVGGVDYDIDDKIFTSGVYVVVAATTTAVVTPSSYVASF